MTASHDEPLVSVQGVWVAYGRRARGSVAGDARDHSDRADQGDRGDRGDRGDHGDHADQGDSSDRADDNAHAIRDVSLDIRAGEFVAIAGPNGAGKSTLARAMAGLLAPARGSVRLGGQRIQALARRDVARRVAYLPQIVRPFETTTVREMVALGRYPHQRGLALGHAGDDDAVAAAMRDARVDDLAARPFASLSGGEQQRVLLGAVFAQQAPLLLLDEPTANLDLDHAGALFELLRVRTRGAMPCGVCVVTHDVTLAAQLADRLVLMKRGRVIADGPPAEALTEAALREVYGERAMLMIHPATGRPVVLPSPAAALDAAGTSS